MASERCFECGGEMVMSLEGTHYRALPTVSLRNVPVWRCSDCGEFEIALPRILELSRLIARVLLGKKGRLTGGEAKFLRKHLGMATENLAVLMELAPEDVTAWEQGDAELSTMQDRFLRLLVATEEPIDDYRDQLPSLGTGTAEPTPYCFQTRDEEWELCNA